MTKDADIIVIGAGAAGLYLANLLSEKGLKVLVLEARDRVGGRIHTIRDKFSIPVDLGAEFIHGDLPLTKKLFRRAGSTLFKMSGEMYRIEQGRIVEEDDFIEGRSGIMECMNKLREDMPLLVFLDEYFSDPALKNIRESMISMAEGFDAADVSRISTFAVRDEWNSDSVEGSLKVDNGYGALISYLYDKTAELGGAVILNSVCKQLRWKPGSVTITTADSREWNADAAVVTVPPGVLTGGHNSEAALVFDPPVPEKLAEIATIGYGGVVKVILQFRSVVWSDKSQADKVAQLEDPDFIFCDGIFPTWWTQSPKRPVITGWAGGPNAIRLSDLDENEILKRALISLASALKTTPEYLAEQLSASEVCNWVKDPFSAGAYSYETPESRKLRQSIICPVDGTIFFAGEAFSPAGGGGTVDAAFESAAHVAEHFTKKI